MPTVLSDSDHLSLNSLSTLPPPHLPPLTGSHPPYPPHPHHFYHRRSSFPSHFRYPTSHPPSPPPSAHYLHHQYNHLPPHQEEAFLQSASIQTSPAFLGPNIRLGRSGAAAASPSSAFPPCTVSTPKARSRKKARRIPKQRHSNGPKWIHRHGLINGINYHWVETTNLNEEDEDGVKPTDKPLVVLLHGFPQFWYAWRHQIVPLGEMGYRVVAPDLRGFNLTDKPAEGPSSSKRNKSKGDNKKKTKKTDGDDECAATDSQGYDMQTLTADVRALIMYLGHSEANIVGHDWGGIIAWAFAARFPQHTTKLVVMNAPHLCRWRDVVTDYTSASCVQQAWWTCWYTLCCQLLPSWIPESILSYHRSWILTHSMSSASLSSSYLSSCWGSSSTSGNNGIKKNTKNLISSCALQENSIVQDGFPCASATAQPATARGFPDPGRTSSVGGTAVGEGGGGGGGCVGGCWKATDNDLYRDAISRPGAIYALLEYYRNLWLSVQQMEQYGKIHQDLPILVLWGLKDKTFPSETFAQGWEEWIECSSSSSNINKDSRHQDQDDGKNNNRKSGNIRCSAPSVTVSLLDCGHFTPEEVPDEVNQNLLDFFQQPLPLLSAEL